jgi:hypothetical protein
LGFDFWDDGLDYCDLFDLSSLSGSTAFSFEIVGRSLSALAFTISDGIFHMKMAPSAPTETMVF